MNDLQKLGGGASLAAAATYLFGFVILFAVLEPAGWVGAAPADAVDILLANQGLLYLWNVVIYVLNALVLVVLVLALHERLKSGAPALSAFAAAFGLIWAGVVLASGMLANVGAEAVAGLAATDQAGAAALFVTVSTVTDGLGGGVEVTGGVWLAALSWAALRTGRLPAPLNWFGLVVGLAGVVTLIPPAGEIGGAVFGLGCIAWFVWAGIFLLRGAPAAA